MVPICLASFFCLLSSRSVNKAPHIFPNMNRRDVDEYKRASARTFRHILMNCTLLLPLTGLRQQLPDSLPELPRDQRDFRRV